MIFLLMLLASLASPAMALPLIVGQAELYTRDTSQVNLTNAYASTGVLAASLTSKNNLCIVNGAATKLYFDTSPVANCANTVVSAAAGPTSAGAATLSSGLTQPPYAKILTITPGGTTADVAACVITVSGYDGSGAAITDTFTFVDNQTSTVIGKKKFRTVSQIDWAANCEDGGFAATWTIKTGDSFIVPASQNACFEKVKLYPYLCARSSSGTISSGTFEALVW